MAKVGRNDPCPCRSGKKFKKCHGAIRQPNDFAHLLNSHINMTEAIQVQRQRQQGLGRPIVSTEAFGRRFVAVNKRLMYSSHWRTFHDFLFEYIKSAMGREWGAVELEKPLEQQHPIFHWCHRLTAFIQSYPKTPGVVNSGPLTGAVAAYLHLAYDLYSLEHNAELQKKLIARLRNRENFPGARYEVFVAATLIRAGFDIEFENEDDRSTSHCEFTATFRKTGMQFSVECKRKEPNPDTGEVSLAKIGGLLTAALMKTALHERIVFLDLNVPDEPVELGEIPGFVRFVRGRLRKLEANVANGGKLPSAYIVLTNRPHHYHLDKADVGTVALIDGFKIPDFKTDMEHPSLRAQLEARERHVEMYELLQSMQDHMEVPSTFDGDDPELALDKSKKRLTIGERYLIKDANGRDRIGLMTTATVAEQEKLAYCGLLFDDDTAGIYTFPLSDAELRAWKRHPDTFFGIVTQRKTKVKTPLELYDFFHHSYRQTPRERLLELLANAQDVNNLTKLDQPALVSIYAERCTYAALAVEAQQQNFGVQNESATYGKTEGS